MMRRFRTGVVVVLASAIAIVAEAQPAPRHAGFAWAAGVAQGKLRTSCTACVEAQKEGGLSFVFRGGWTLHDQLVVSFDGLIYQKQQENIHGDPANTDYQLYTVDARVYPSPRWETFLVGGFGIARLSQQLDTSLGLRDVKATGPAIRIGAGTDLPLGRKWRLSPFVDYVLGLATDTNVDGLKTKTSIIAFGLAVAFP